MITRAYLVGSRPAEPDGFVGGMSVLLRQALSLQDAGILELLAIDLPEASLRDALGADARLRLVPAQASTPGDDQPALVARVGTVWHPQLVRRLARTAVGPGDLVAAGSADGAVYACGRSRVGEVVRAVASTPSGAALPYAPDRLEPPEFAVVPRNASDTRMATTLLLRSLQKSSDGVASRHVHRRISLAITRLLLPHAITPNQMTLVAAVFGVLGVAAACRGGYLNLLLGAALFEIQNILDGCDGEIARLKYLRSRSGEWLDQIVDDVLNVAFMAGVGFALARDGAGFLWWLTIAAVAAEAVHAAAVYAGLLVKAGGRGSVSSLKWWVGSVHPAQQGGFRLTLGDLTRRDFIAFAYLVLAACHLIGIVFVWQAFVAIGSAIVTTLQWVVWGGPVFYSGEVAADEAASGAPAATAASRASR